MLREYRVLPETAANNVKKVMVFKWHPLKFYLLFLEVCELPFVLHTDRKSHITAAYLGGSMSEKSTLT